MADLVQIVRATLAHAAAMVGRLRAGDAAEVEALGVTQLEALEHGVRASAWARTALVGGEPAAMWGVAAEGLLGGVGNAWLLTTPLVEQHKKRLVRQALTEFAAMREAFPVLHGIIDPDYRQAVRLVERLGCRVSGQTFEVVP